MKRKFERGSVYYGTLNNTGSVQTGKRPLLVIQNNIGNTHSKTVIVVPITSRKKKSLPTHVKLHMPETSLVLCEQIQTVNASDLAKTPIYTLTKEEMDMVDSALIISLGIRKED